MISIIGAFISAGGVHEEASLREVRLLRMLLMSERLMSKEAMEESKEAKLSSLESKLSV